MSYSLMPTLTRPPSRDISMPTSPSRRLSREETYHLAETARRKSLNKVVHDDLRIKLSHEHLLDRLLRDIARSEREYQTSPTEDKFLMPTESKTTPVQQTSSLNRTKAEPQVDEYGFLMEEDDGGEDLSSLSLTRTPSRRPSS